MLKRSLTRGITGFAFGVSVGQMLQLLFIALSGKQGLVPLVPAFRSYFASDVMAVGVSNFFVGVISAVFAMSSVIFEIERWSFLKQGIVHFCVTTIVWFPIAAFLWGLFIYPQAVWRTLLGFFFTYAINWIIQYRLCRNAIKDINQTIQKREE